MTAREAVPKMAELVGQGWTVKDSAKALAEETGLAVGSLLVAYYKTPKEALGKPVAASANGGISECVSKKRKAKKKEAAIVSDGGKKVYATLPALEQVLGGIQARLQKLLDDVTKAKESAAQLIAAVSTVGKKRGIEAQVDQ